MKILYLDCRMGVAGDMLMAALLELLPEGERQGFIDKLNGLGIPGVHAAMQRTAKCGVMGTHVAVTVHGEDEEDFHHHAHEHAHGEHDHPHHEHERGHGEHNHPHHEHEHGHSEHDHPHHEHGHGHHHHASLADITAVIDGLNVPDAVKKRAAAVYTEIAKAESAVHGREVGEVHFHEVGAMDAVADVVGVSWLLDMLAPERIVVSPVRTGFGQVRCAHGILPVPAPATALILEDIPVFAGDIEGEMTTPTGAALVRAIAGSFGEMPAMRMSAVGYGMGTRDFPAANCVRAVLGESEERGADVAEIFCTLDDVTAEDLGYAQEALLAAGALDVFTASVGMKKGRPGTLLCCLCDYGRREEFARLMLMHTPTLGVRIYTPERMKLHRSVETVETEFGAVRIKRGSGFGIEKSKPEYDDLARIARETGLTISEVRRRIGNK